MADCYIVRRGGAGGEKGVIDLTDKDCLVNMLETWFLAEGTVGVTNGYVLFSNGVFFTAYNSGKQLKLQMRYDYPTTVDFLLNSRVSATVSSSSYNVTKYDFTIPNSMKVGSYTYLSEPLSNKIVYISEDVECSNAEIKKHFGTWFNYGTLRYIDVVKYPAQNNGNVFTDYIIMKQVYNSNTWLTTLALKNPSIVRINTYDTAPKAKLQTDAEYICYYTHSVSNYDPSIQLNNEYINNPSRTWYFTDADAVLNGVAFTTCDILYEDGTIAVKANCTIDDVIQRG